MRDHEPAPRCCIVVMGVAGSGKSAVGAALAEALGATFVDGDDLHTESSRAKMQAGRPLEDLDRWPWLDRIADALTAKTSTPDLGVVVAASVLKRTYRDRVRDSAPATTFVHLSGPRYLLEKRILRRPAHFMPLSLLDSQLAALEPLQRDEKGQMLSIALPIPDIVYAVQVGLRTHRLTNPGDLP